MNPVSAMTAIAGTSSVPRNDVSHGPRIGLRQNMGLMGLGVGRPGGSTGHSGGLTTASFRDSVTDTSTPHATLYLIRHRRRARIEELSPSAPAQTAVPAGRALPRGPSPLTLL